MKRPKYTIAELESFKKEFKNFIEQNISYLEKPETLPANKVIFGDVVSFKTKLIKEKPFSSNPYVCFKNGYLGSRNQSFQNHSPQILYKIGTIDLTQEQVDIFEELYVYNNN